MEKEAKEQQWEQEEEEEEELEEGLHARRKMPEQEAKITTILNGDATSIINVNGDGNFSSCNGGSVVAVSNGEEGDLKDSAQEQENGLKIVEDEKQQRFSENCVYYDTNKGVWKCRVCSWDGEGRTCISGHTQNPKQKSHMLVNVKTVDQQRPCFIHQTKGTPFHYESSLVEQNGVECSASKENPVEDDVDQTIRSYDDGNGLNSVIGNQNGSRRKQDNFSDNNSIPLSELAVEKLDESLKSFGKNEIESEDTDLIIDGDKEVNEFDVETVLKKQGTHDLYCPNCNSCITKRVILRKRKHRIRTPGEDAKRNKPETLIPSESDVVSADANNDQSCNRVDVNLDDSPPPASDEHGHQREPDVFRCLSCFSIFMPTGNGFKLLRMFGDKSDKQNNQGSQKAVHMKKGWFSSIFASDKMEVLTDQGSLQSANLDQLNDQASSRQEANSHTTDHRTGLENKQAADHVQSSNLNESKNHSSEVNQVLSPAPSGDNNAPSTEKGPTTFGKSIVDESDDAIRKSKGGASMDCLKAGTVDQLNSSNFSYHMRYNDKTDHPETPILKPPLFDGDPSENAIASPQQDGLKLLIPSKMGSLVVQSSAMNQNLDVTVQNHSSGSDENGTTVFFSPSISVLRESNLGSQMSDHSGKSAILANSGSTGTDKQMDKDRVSGISQQHIVQNKVEIHIGEPSDVDDAAIASTIQGSLLLQDSHINLSKDLKDMPIEVTIGKDTIIAVATTEPLRPQTIPSGTGTVALRQIQSANATVEEGGTTAAESRSMDVIKSIVYGGLIESITSLSVVSSAAGANAATVNVLALGLANIFGGLVLISHDLWDLKNEHTREASDEVAEQPDRYQQLLGRREDFPLHAVIALLSYLVFGLLPPVVYGFSFRKSDDRDLKLIMVAAASIICIATLAVGKAYVQRPPKSYFKTIVYYVVMGFMVSGVSYVFGNLIIKLLDKIGVFPSGSGSVVNLALRGESSTMPVLGSY